MMQYVFETLRLGFRLWQESDRDYIAKMNADKDVMRFFPDLLSTKQSNEFFDIISDNIKKKGFGLWAVEIKKTKDFIGFIGFSTATFDEDFTPFTEIGWRLNKKYWNQGYATEGAKGCLDFGFNNLGFDQIYSYTTQINNPSINVMRKIGMKLDRTFSHPAVREDDPLSLHVLYKIDRNKKE